MLRERRTRAAGASPPSRAAAGAASAARERPSGAGQRAPSPGQRSGVTRFATSAGDRHRLRVEPLVERERLVDRDRASASVTSTNPTSGLREQRVHRRRPLLEALVHALEALEEVAEVASSAAWPVKRASVFAM